MKSIPLGGKQGSGKYLLADDEDHERVCQYNWCISAYGYAVARIDAKVVLAHRFILGLKKGDGGIDHRNGDPLDCTRSNLRPCTQAQNLQNIRHRCDSSSPFKGVEYRDKCTNSPYRAYIRKDGKRRGLGAYADAETAARAYDKKAFELFGEFARTNFPRSDYEH